MSSESPIYGQGDSVIHHSDFIITLKKGYLDIAAELIESTGACLPFETLVKQTGPGAKDAEKPKVGFL